MFIHGVYIWGASWEKTTGELIDAPPRHGCTALPVIHVTCWPTSEKPSSQVCTGGKNSHMIIVTAMWYDHGLFSGSGEVQRDIPVSSVPITGGGEEAHPWYWSETRRHPSQSLGSPGPQRYHPSILSCTISKCWSTFFCPDKISMKCCSLRSSFHLLSFIVWWILSCDYATFCITINKLYLCWLLIADCQLMYL